MGLFGFIGDLFSNDNEYQAKPMEMNNFNYDKALNQAQAGALGSINAGQGTAAQQQALAAQLAAQASGQGPSLAQMQLQQAADQNIKNAGSMIAGVKGINPAQAARQVALAQQAQGQNLANQSGQLRLQEQMAKQGLLANTLGTQRGQDLGQQQANTQMFQTTGGLRGQQEALNLQNYWNAQNVNAGIAQNNANASNAITGGILGGVASMGASLLGGGGSSGGGGGGGYTATPSGYNSSGAGMLGGGLNFAEGGVVPETQTVAVSPGEKIVHPSGEISGVPGKAHYEGDDPRNDTVIADLRADSIVVPRSKSGDKEKMIDFIKHMKKSSEKKSDLQQILESHQELKQKLDEVNYKLGRWSPK
jgi:hypothetical protein